MTDDSERTNQQPDAQAPDVDPAAKTQPAEGGVDEVDEGDTAGGATGGDPSRVLDER